jgi:hypothetical protein
MNLPIDWSYVVPALIIGTMGWMLYLAGMPIIGLGVGAGAGALLGLTAGGMVKGEWARTALIVGGAILGGGLGFWLIRMFQIYLFFIAGACVGGVIGLHLANAAVGHGLMPPSVGGTLLVEGLAAVLGGILCVQGRRFVIAIVTSVLGMCLLVPGLPPAWRGPGMVIGLVAFLAIQVGLARRFVTMEAFDRRARAHATRRIHRPGED